MLCGGQSRRMGRDKAVLPVDGRTLVEHVVGLIRPWVDEVVLSARAGQAGLPDERVVFDRAPDRGPLPAAVDALEFVSCDVVLMLAVDTPRLVPALIPLLESRLADADVAVPWVNGHPVMALSVVRRDAVRRVAPLLPEGAGLRDLLPLLRCVAVNEVELRTVDPGLQSFLPCNTPEEFAAAFCGPRAEAIDRPGRAS